MSVETDIIGDLKAAGRSQEMVSQELAIFHAALIRQSWSVAESARAHAVGAFEAHLDALAAAYRRVAI